MIDDENSTPTSAALTSAEAAVDAASTKSAAGTTTLTKEQLDRLGAELILPATPRT